MGDPEASAQIVTEASAQVVNNRMTTVKVKTPVFDSVNKTYDRYLHEIKMWQIVCKIDKKEQAVYLAYELPENDPSGIRDKLFSELDPEKLNCDDGMKTYIDYLDKLFKKDEQTEAYEAYVKFDSYRRSTSQKLTDFLMEFDKLYNLAAKRDMKLPSTVRAFKLLDAAKLTKQDRMFVLTGIDFSKKETLYEQTQLALKKFTGEQMCNGGASSSVDIKIEPTFNVSSADLTNPTAQVEEALASMGFYRKKGGPGSGGRGNGSGGRGFKGGRGARGGRGAYSNNGDGGRGAYGNSGDGSQRSLEKPVNPKNENGDTLTCISCGSFRHMLDTCPHSYENMKKRINDSLVSQTDMVDVVLYTGYGETQARDVSLLLFEAVNKGVLDCGCSSTVTGERWMESYLGTLSDAELATVTYGKSGKHFKFGGGEVLGSLYTVDFPCRIAGREVRMVSDVVSSDIPLLISKKSMKKAGAVLDLVNDRVRFFGKWITCDVTSSGHYTINLGSEEIKLNDVMVALSTTNSDDTRKALQKLHRQFGHPTYERLSNFLKGAEKWESPIPELLKDIHAECDICKLFKKTPPRPVVSLPIASEFGQILTMDLKEYKLPGVKYILHMIDAFTRFSVSTFLPRKLTSLVVEKILSRWVAVFGTPGRIWSDLGGEFNSEEMKEMGEILNVELGTAAGMAPWMNGLCERNHQITDFCLEKILYENPHMNPEMALIWATSAKNTLQMNNGFSSHQLVFGKNPKLPSALTDSLPALEATTSSESIAEHIKAMHTARRAFIASESHECIRRAMSHKVRSVERPYNTGQRVYYKRDGEGSRWRGPAVVIGRDGSVVFLKHQDSLLRVPTCRLQPIVADLDKEKGDEKTSNDPPPIVSDIKSKVITEVTNGSSNSETLPGAESSLADGARVVSNDVPEANHLAVPKRDDRIKYKLLEDSEWEEGVVISRAGKQSGENKYCVNVQPSTLELPKCVNLKCVDKWEYVSDVDNLEEVNLVLIPKRFHKEERCILAKNKELALFHEFDVYDTVKDQGQTRISCTWVLSEKLVNGEKVTKARLVARGFEETESIQSDSPTCGKDAFRIFLAIASSNHWIIESTDIKSAFLQGQPLTREVYVEPPVEAEQTGVLWRLKKCMYGLNDAPRRWFLNVTDELKKLNCQPTRLDPSVFVYTKDETLHGIVLIHVDDFLHIGTEYFQEDVVSKIRVIFRAGKLERRNFSYVGLDIKQTDTAVSLCQTDYITKLIPIHMPSTRRAEKT